MNFTTFRIEINGSLLLPDVYFNYEAAKAALKNIEENNVATFGRVIMVN